MSRRREATSVAADVASMGEVSNEPVRRCVERACRRAAAFEVKIDSGVMLTCRLHRWRYEPLSKRPPWWEMSAEGGPPRPADLKRLDSLIAILSEGPRDLAYLIEATDAKPSPEELARARASRNDPRTLVRGVPYLVRLARLHGYDIRCMPNPSRGPSIYVLSAEPVQT